MMCARRHLAVFIVLTAATRAAPAHADDAVRILERAERGELSAALRDAETARLSPADRAQLLGHLGLMAQDLPSARAQLSRAVELEPGRAAAWLELAVVEHLLGAPERSLEALRRGRALGRDRPTFYALAASNLRSLDDLAGAWLVIGRGVERLSTSPDLLRLRVALALDLGLVETALEASAALFDRSEDASLERRWVARRLVEVGSPQEALPLLEVVHATSPMDVRVAAELAWAYAQAGRPGAAARALDPRRLGSTRYAYEAAEHYRAVGAMQDALRVNRWVEPEAKRLAQHVVILVADGQPERALAAVAGRGPGALDDTARFALAWAALELGHPTRAANLLQKIQAPERFMDLPRLRAAVERAAER